MGAQILSIFNRPTRPARGPSDWTQQEIAEFYRVESALIRAGLRIETDRGLSDEGEPWFVFLRGDDGEVVIHFARIDGEYIIGGPAYADTHRGLDFTSLVRNMIARHPLVQPQRRDSNVMLHPAALLIAVVGTAFFKSGEAKAMDNSGGPAARRTAATATAASASPPAASGASAARAEASTSVHLDANQAMTVLAGAMFALEHAENAAANGARAALNFAAANPTAPHVFLASNNGATLEFSAPHGTELASNGAMAAQQASAVLSLMAILESLPQQALPNLGANAFSPVSTNDAAPLPETSPLPQQSAPITTQSQMLLEVRLQAAALPDVMAVRLLMEIGPGRFSKVGVVELDKLPAAIANFVTVGDANGQSAPFVILSNLPIAAGAPVVDAGQALGHETLKPADDHMAEGKNPTQGPGTIPLLPASEGLTASGQPDATPNNAGVAQDKPTTASIMLSDQWSLATKLIDYFIEHTLKVNFMSSGSDLIFVDDRVLHNANEINQVGVVSFNFADGSSVSLVGEYSTLHFDFGHG